MNSCRADWHGMTNNKMIRSIAGLFVAGLLAASCGGSSDESSTAEFCEKITAVEAAGDDSEDITQADLDVIQDMADSAPGEIKDEVALMNNLFKDLFEAGDDEEKLLAIFTGSDSEAFDAAGEKLDAWEAENCEASTSSAPASAVGRI
ncbi:MAG: hypothetical protein ACI91O_000279 [Candidatus Poriferisodalaceae bacterium]